MTELKDFTALVTGANRGIGAAFAAELLAAGAKVYAAARDPRDLPEDLLEAGAEAVRLDVTDVAQVQAAAAACPDVSLLINNAGYHAGTRLVLTDDPDAARREMEVNYFGPLNTTRAFAPVLGANGGGAVINVLSVAAIAPTAFMGGYSTSKVATLYLSGITRAELEPQGTRVTALVVGSVDTRMASHVAGQKEKPSDIARAGLKAMLRGEHVFDTDWMAVDSRARLARDPARYQRGLAKLLHATDLRTGR